MQNKAKRASSLQNFPGALVCEWALESAATGPLQAAFPTAFGHKPLPPLQEHINLVAQSRAALMSTETRWFDHLDLYGKYAVGPL